MDADRALLRRLNSVWPWVYRKAQSEAGQLPHDRLRNILTLACAWNSRRGWAVRKLWTVPLVAIACAFVAAQFALAGPFGASTLAVSLAQAGGFVVLWGFVIAGLATIYVRPSRALPRLCLTVGRTREPAFVGCLLECLSDRLHTGTGSTRGFLSTQAGGTEAAIGWQLRLLMALMSQEDVDMLTRDQRGGLLAILRAPYIDSRLTCEAVRVAAMSGDERMGRVLKTLAEVASRYPDKVEVRNAAAEHLPLYYSRRAERGAQDRLLRPAQPADADTLLRPGRMIGQTDPSTLLMPAASDCQ